MVSTKIIVKVMSILLAMVLFVALLSVLDSKKKRIARERENIQLQSIESTSLNPLSGRKFYHDTSRQINKLVQTYREQGNEDNAKLAEMIANQPGSIWLIGPSASDPMAQQDINEVTRTSHEAKIQDTIPIYVLYAIPRRDACAEFSKGGFLSSSDYLDWVNRIKTALTTDAIVIIEPDALAHTNELACFNEQQQSDRYATIRETVYILSDDPRILGIYIDVGNAEWKVNPQELVEPLKHSGIERARGIAVNIASFVSTPKTVQWTQRLLKLIGGNKGAVIDTSRNGNGVVNASVTGTARWCNPPGRSLGYPPTTNVPSAHIDAYIWGKKIGESDGDCFGNPAAGTFVPSMALDLARNTNY